MCFRTIARTAVLLCAVAVPSAFAGEPVTVVQGEVTDADGNPIPFAKVTLQVEDTRYVRWTTYNDRPLGTYYHRLPNDLITSVESPDNARPGTATLHQNSPNPFNPSTAITYELARSADVRLSVYNAAGQRVKILEHGRKSAGVYTVRWNARNDDGQAVGAGVYLYRLEADGARVTRKMLLLDGGAAGPGMAMTSQPAAKPAAQLPTMSVTVEKDGYLTHHADNLMIPANGEPLELNVTLTRDFTPGDFFPLAPGSSWTYVTTDMTPGVYAHERCSVSPDRFLEEWTVSVVDSVTIDVNMYCILDRYSPLLPDNRGLPIGEMAYRINEDGDLVQNTVNGSAARDEIVYEFSDPDIYEGTTHYGHLTLERECIVKTPAGTYTDCRMARCWDSNYTIYFSRSAGPVYVEDETEGRSISSLKKRMRAVDGSG